MKPSMMIRKKCLSFLAASLLAVASGHAQGDFSDNFDRADGTGIGSGWSEFVGDWEIFSGLARSVQDDLTTEKLLVYEPIAIDRAFVIEADVNWTPLRNQWNGPVWSVQSNNTFYMLRVRGDNGNVQLIKRIDGANAAVLVNQGGAAGPLEEGVFHRLTVRGDGTGKFWWSVKKGEETLASGSVIDEDPLPAGPSGIYAGREAIEVDSFRVATFDLGGEVDDLGIDTAVEVFFTTRAGEFYQIQSSTDLAAWIDEGELIEGDGEEFSAFFSARGQPRRFFRVITSAQQ